MIKKIDKKYSFDIKDKVDNEVSTLSYEQIAPHIDSIRDIKLSEIPFLKTIVDYELGILPHVEISQDGNVYTNGRLLYKDQKQFYRPFVVRGHNYNHGLYFQSWLDEIQISRPWQDIVNALNAGHWFIDGENCEELEYALFDIEGGYRKFISEALTALITGFAVFEKVYCPITYNINKLSFRYTNQITRWIFDADQTTLVAVEMRTNNKTSIVPAKNLLIITVNGFGLDFEGTSPLRPVVKYVEIKDMINRIEQLAAEKYGAPIFVIKTNKAEDADDDAYLVNVVDAIASDDLAVFTLPDGREFELVSPNGVMPDFGPIKQYCNEQISMALTGESNLIGFGQTGSYALADVADSKSVRQAPAYANIICDALNGSRGTPWHGVIRDMFVAKYGMPDKGFPKLKWSAKKDDKRSLEWFDKVSKAKDSGLITWTDEDEQRIRLELDLYQDEESI